MADRVPQMLPPDTTHFTDREGELDALDALLTTPAQTVVITAIAGTAGMGKTSLAVRWAHRVRDQFPDGQLYVNLRGYDPGPAVAPEQALDSLLRALDVPGEAIPHGIDAMAGHYRSLVAGRRMLVVLDNAATPDQARPLLPASPTCVVLVTSRSRLSGLVALDGARRITLDLLPSYEAITLLRAIIGPNRADREPEAVAELARRCANLPLALRIAAERVTARQHLRIADLVDDLTHEQGRLDILATDDDETSAVRAVFSWSYRALTAEAARVFRLLGLHPGPEISVPAAAALTDRTPATVRRLLDVLAGVHLLEEIGPDRYTFHDLLRAYAAERAADDETDMNRVDATRRIFDWYLHTAFGASRILSPHQPQRPIDSPDADCRPLAFTSYEHALRWFDAERGNLTATVRHAADTGWHVTASQLPAAMVIYLFLRSRWADLIAAYQIGLTSARHIQDQRAEIEMLAGLSDAYVELDRLDEALTCARYELVVAQRISDRRSEGAAMHGQGMALHGMGKYDEAISSFQRALVLYRETGDKRGEAAVLNWIGDAFRNTRRLIEALDHSKQGLTILQSLDSRYGETFALYRLGLIYRDLHRLDEAIGALVQALRIQRDLDHRYPAAKTLHTLGEVQHSVGQADEARQSWREALAILDELRSPKAAEVRARLDALRG